MLTPETAPPAEDPWLGCNPFDPAFRDDPYPSLARLREIDPVNEMPVGIWRLTRYADVNRLLHEVPAGVRTTDGVLPGVDVEGDARPRLPVPSARDARRGAGRRHVAGGVLRRADRRPPGAPLRGSALGAHPRRGGRRSPDAARAALAGDRAPDCRLR